VPWPPSYSDIGIRQAGGIRRLAVHAEESRPGGELLLGESPDVAMRYAVVFARVDRTNEGPFVRPA